jgi:hypothetical protein
MPMFHLPLLGGLALLGVPIALHLLLRQKPKQVRFPAFRFLRQRARVNQRKLRLRHILLLLLRMGLLALLVLALASLRGDDQSGSLLIVVDTSPSMEYILAGRSRLDEAKTRALQWLERASSDSRVAVFDTTGAPATWGSVAEARNRIANLQIRPGAVPVTTTLVSALRLLADPSTSPPDADAPAKHPLLILSDRTPSSWSSDRVPELREMLGPEGAARIESVYVDLSVPQPVDVAITELELVPNLVMEGRDVKLRAAIRAVGQDCETDVICKVLREGTTQRKPVTLRAGESTVVEFLGRSFPAGFQQIEVALATTDAVPSSDRRFITVEVRGPRKVLVLTDNPKWARAWLMALDVHGRYQPEVLEPAALTTIDQLKPYVAVILLSVARPAELWPKLREYVQQGGHLLVAPGRSETKSDDYNTPEAESILPGRLLEVVNRTDADPGRWDLFDRRHPLVAKFIVWREREDIGFLRFPRNAQRYWKVAPLARENVLIAYGGAERHPAVLERVAERSPGSGRVVLLTTPIDFRPDEPVTESWNDYLSTVVNDGFYVVFANELLAYLTGEIDPTPWNYLAGQVVTIPLTPTSRFSEYTLDAPGITGSQTRVSRNENDPGLTLTNTQFVGNARVLAARGSWQAAFSLNIPSSEFDLAAIPVERIEELLGPDTVVPSQDDARLSRVVESHWGRGIELFPWLMLALLGFFAVEGLMANRFYRSEAPTHADMTTPTSVSLERTG